MFNNSNDNYEEDPRERFKRLIASLESDDTQTSSVTRPSHPAGLSLPPSGAQSSQSSTTPGLADTQPLRRKPQSQTIPSTPPPGSNPYSGSSNRYPAATVAVNQSVNQGSPKPAAKQNRGAHPALAVKAANQPASRPVKARRSVDSRSCLLRSAMAGAFVLVIIALCGASIMFYQYYRIASQLPDISDLRARASKFETTRIMDRDGAVLYEILDPDAGRRTYVPLSRISPYLVAATIATEDKSFYSHPGFDVTAIFRAFLQNYQSGGIASGASTITQQLSRTLLFSPEEKFEQSYRRKVREAILAAEITRRYSKDEILEIYLNENFYGNFSYGVQAAAETYFNTSADRLTLSQAAFLAGLPQAPAIYDVYTNPEDVFERQEDVLVLMYQASQEQGCIFVSNSPQRVCLTPLDITTAANEIKTYTFQSPDIEMRYPHWVNFIRTLLESQFDSQTIYRSGFSVYTTLDPALQDLAEQAVKEQVELDE